MRRLAVLAAAGFVLAGCAGGGGPVDPVADPATTIDSADSERTVDETNNTTDPTVAPTTSAATVAPATTSTTAAPTTAVPPTVPVTTAAPTSAPGGTPVTDPRFDAVEPIMTDFVEANGLNGAGLVIVDREDGIVHEEYLGDFTRDRVSLIASSSKMITAGVVLRLADDGLLDLDAPISDVVEWGTGNPDVTAAQLVSNSSGLGGLFSPLTTTAYVCQFAFDGELEECGAEVFTTGADDDAVVPPDTEFRYGGAQWQVAGAVAESASGATWAQLIDEIYVEPCGVDSLGYTNQWASAAGFDYPTGFDPAALAPTENPNMEGGAYITPPDYAELLLMHLRNGECGDGRVLSAAAVERAHTDHVAATYPGGGAGHPGYGFGWWIDRDTGILTDAGAYGSVPWLDLADGYGAYLVIEADSTSGLALHRQLEPVVDQIMTG